MSLTTTSFIIPVIYGTLFLIGYVILAYLILKNWKILRGSFYRLYLSTTVMNIFGYLNIYIIFRIPQNTCKNCLLGPFFANVSHFWGLEFFNFMYVHMNSLHHVMSLLISFNRFTMMFFPFNFEKMWNDWWIHFIVIGFLAPTICNYSVLFGQSSYVYVEALDRFQTRSTSYVTHMFTNIVIFNFVITIINLILTIATCVRLYTVQMKNRSAIRKTELNLFMMSLATFSVHMLDIIRVIINNFMADNVHRSTKLSVILVTIEPYFADAMALLPPLFLVICSSVVRQLIIPQKYTVSKVTVSANQKAAF